MKNQIRRLKQRYRNTRARHQRCNICDRTFRSANMFNRFCKDCKADNELFKFYEWLPQN